MKIYLKTWRMLILPLAMLLMGIYGIRVCMEMKSLWIGMILIFFSIMGLYFGIYPFVYFRPLITIDERGIKDKRMKIGFIPWSDISRVMVHTMLGHPGLCVVLKSSEAYMHKGISVAGNVQRVSQAINEPGLFITYGDFSHTREEVMQYISENMERFKNGQADKA